MSQRFGFLRKIMQRYFVGDYEMWSRRAPDTRDLADKQRGTPARTARYGCPSPLALSQRFVLLGMASCKHRKH